jgi:hypothetical protein
MKRLVLGLALVSFFMYAAPLLACDCDPATALLTGMKDRLHQPWPNDPQRFEGKAKNTENGPKQEVQPASRDAQPNRGEIKK